MLLNGIRIYRRHGTGAVIFSFCTHGKWTLLVRRDVHLSKFKPILISMMEWHSWAPETRPFHLIELDVVGQSAEWHNIARDVRQRSWMRRTNCGNYYWIFMTFNSSREWRGQFERPTERRRERIVFTVHGIAHPIDRQSRIGVKREHSYAANYSIKKHNLI